MSVNQTTVKSREAYPRATMVALWTVVGVAGLVSATLTLSFFIRWSNTYNAAYYAAVEVGQRPSFSLIDYLQGVGFALAATTSITVTLISASRLLIRQFASWRATGNLLWTLGLASVALAVVGTIFSPLLGAPFLVVAVVLVLTGFVTGKNRVRSGAHVGGQRPGQIF